jgi:hypothetical protein
MIAISRYFRAVLFFAGLSLLAGCSTFNGHSDAKAGVKNSAVAKKSANTVGEKPATDHFPTAAEKGL